MPNGETQRPRGLNEVLAGLFQEAAEKIKGELPPHLERIDAFERTIFDAIGTSRTPELRGIAARIIEEGARPRDLLTPPTRRGLTVATAILMRAFRPPFKLSDNALLGKSQRWEVQE